MEMSRVLFSVVIPLYNKADTVERTLRSVRCQSYRDFEVVVVDDGSTDNGAEIVSRFKGIEFLRLIRKKNEGVSVARNCGVREAKGQYVAFLDADDEWTPDFLSEIYRALVRYPKAKVLGSGYERLAGNYIYRCRSRRKIFVCNLFRMWPFFQPMNSSSIVIEKSAYCDVGGYTPGLSFWEDGELWFKLARKHLFYIVRKPLSRYNDDSVFNATRCRLPDHRADPHLDLLQKWIDEGTADSSIRFCLINEMRNRRASLSSDPLFWLYKRIRFYLWFSRSSRHA